MSYKIKVMVVIQFCWMTTAILVKAQERDSLSTKKNLSIDSISSEKLDEIFSYSDSLSIFNMIDSLLKKQANVGSSLVLRAGFNSNIISAGRTIGVNQYGATIGGSYYHKTGFFLDASSYWSESYNPNLYLTIISLGYLKTLSKHYSIMASYDKLIYHTMDINVENPLKNMIGFSNFLDFKPVTVRLDYSFYFGDQNAHRLTPGIVVSLRKYNFLGLDRISFTPSYQILFGSATITTIQLAQRSTTILGKKVPLVQQLNQDQFGLMNHAISFPLRITKKNWSLAVSYTYNWPVALKGEESSLPENSYTSFTVSKMINFKAH